MIRQPSPPRWATRLLRWYCRPDLEGDLREYFERHVKTRGAKRARLIYIVDVLKFFRPYTIQRPTFINIFIHWIMLASYAKTSARNIVRNKLFSGINIFGLSVSMSIALLVVAFVNDLTSYDDFHLNKARIYRLNTQYTLPEGRTINLASASVKAGKAIDETMTGVEGTVLMRNGFGGDATIGEKTLPIEGLWASRNFFEVFTFPLLQGNAATALKEPYSLVVTETSARRMFGRTDVLGQSIHLDSINYVVTGVMKDVPKLSQMQFEMLCSFATAETMMPGRDPNFLSWWSVWSNYVYLMFPEGADVQAWQSNLEALANLEAKGGGDASIKLLLQPMGDVVLGDDLSNQIGPYLPPLVVWILAGLAAIIVLSASFNYTNLSVARALRRSREVGIRKVNGAQRSHVLSQFLTESVLLSLVALCLAVPLFLFLRTQTFALNEHLANMFSMEWSPRLFVYFVMLAIGVGIVSGFLPALFYSRLNAIQVLKNQSTIKVFRHVSWRKMLIVLQYTTSLIFITATFIGYRQYRNMVVFDLGFTTRSIVNVKLQGNSPEQVSLELAKIRQVQDISKSLMVTSIGSIHGSTLKYVATQDSANVWINLVDENYIPLHDHKLVAGGNFRLRPKKTEDSEILVNEQVLKQLKIGNGDPDAAIGEEVSIDGRRLTIIGVLKDFHYGTVMNPIEPTVFRYSSEERNGYLNVKIASENASSTMAAIEAAWRKIDKVHPVEATFYDDQLQRAYDQFSVMVKVIGVVSFLAICISSLGLFGMVVFTTETRMKEVSIRKVLGADEKSLIALLSRGFLLLLLIAAAIALPATYILFNNVILTSLVYHEPIGVFEVTAGAMIIALLAIVMIGAQTWKAARANPATILKSE